MAKKLLLDPSKDEETCHDGEIFVASTAMTNDVLQVNMSGLWSVEDAKEVNLSLTFRNWDLIANLGLSISFFCLSFPWKKNPGS